MNNLCNLPSKVNWLENSQKNKQKTMQISTTKYKNLHICCTTF